MEIKLENIGSVTVVNVEGDIFAEDSMKLKEALEKLFQSNKIKVVLNLGKTNVISSVGLGVILAALIKFRKYSGDICLCQVKDFVKKVLKTTKVDNIVETYEGVQQAIEVMS
ncbi:MAG TPA: STAS domain-containing protein [Candidatus Wallbacteria bacterium]|nr:STAS domain-containing protein [Candidatus Wallbacteria bacterium]